MTGDSWRVEVLDDPEEVVSRGGAWLVGHAVDANVIGSVLASTLAQPVAQRDRRRCGRSSSTAPARSRASRCIGRRTSCSSPTSRPARRRRSPKTLTERAVDVPGASGGPEAARAFCLAWHRLTGRTWEQASAARVYVLDALKPPGGVPGERGTAVDGRRSTSSPPGPTRSSPRATASGLRAASGTW